MTGAAADLLAGWRAWRAAQSADSVPSVPAAAQPPGTRGNLRETAIVPGVPTVPAKNEQVCTRNGATALQDARAHMPLLPVTVPLGGDVAAHHAATRLRRFLADGATARWCESGALDVTLPDGRLHAIAPAVAARLAAHGLLPDRLRPVGAPPQCFPE